MQRKVNGLLIFLVFIVFSCDSKRVFDTYNSLPEFWHQDSVQTFKFDSKDSLSTYNLFLNIRNKEDYPFNNLFLVTEITYPHGKTISDTLEYLMAYPDGSLMGTGFSTVKENKLIYKEGFHFEENGIYTIQVNQAMRKYDHTDGVKALKGITDVGFRIETKN